LRPVIKLIDSALELRTSYVLTKVDVERLSEPIAVRTDEGRCGASVRTNSY